jgi:hypothetical protein
MTFLQPIFDGITHADRRYYLQQQQRQQRQQRDTNISPAVVVVNDTSTHSRMNLSKVINDVYSRYKQPVPKLHQLVGDRVEFSLTCLECASKLPNNDECRCEHWIPHHIRANITQ